MSKTTRQRSTALPSLVSEVGALRLDGDRLAFLAACATMRPTDLRQFDEALHLGSAFLQACFIAVVGTLCEVADRPTAAFVRLFYAHLSQEGLDLRRTATAVRDAARKLRTQHPASPTRWAGFMHLGP